LGETLEFGYKYAERTNQQILEFRKCLAGHLQNSSEVEASAPSIFSTIKPCRASWQKTIRQRETIQSIIADKRFGFITDGNDSFHFTFDAFAARE